MYYEIQQEIRDLMDRLSQLEQKDVIESLLDDYEDEWEVSNGR